MNNLCLYVQEISKIDDSINQNKLSISQVQALWALIDINRKGHLDLNDIYELAGNVTQEQLFAIFKWLDAQRTGQLTMASLQESLGDRQSTSKNHQKQYLFPKFYKIIDSVKDKPKMINELKCKFNFSEQYLRSVYQSVCNLIQSKYISQGELITVFKSQFIKNQLPWTDSIQNLLKTIIPPNNISEAKFMQCFCNKTKKQNESHVEEQLLLNDIPNSYTPQYKEKEFKPYTSVKNTPDNQSKQIFYLHRNNQKRENQAVGRTTAYNNFMSQNSCVGQAKTRVQGSPIRQFSNVNNETNINQVLNNIKQRRERLREDSRERKQLIDTVLQRKRQLCGLNDLRTNQVPVQHSQLPYDIRYSSTYDKPIKTYLHSNPKFINGEAKFLNAEPKFINGEDLVKQGGIYRPQELFNQYNGLCSEAKTVTGLNYLNKSSSQPRFEREGKSIFTDFKSSDFKTAKQQILKSNYNKNFDINQILKRYTTKNAQSPKNQVLSTQINSFKPTLNKSKSGAILQNQSNIIDFNQQKYHLRDSFLTKSKNVSPNHSLSILTGNTNYKQNVMKRAEEQATKKIEEIQRKARMKVLQKKGSAYKQREWGKLIKNYRPNP